MSGAPRDPSSNNTRYTDVTCTLNNSRNYIKRCFPQCTLGNRNERHLATARDVAAVLRQWRHVPVPEHVDITLASVRLQGITVRLQGRTLLSPVDCQILH